jgi:hypothetical protein
VAYARLAALTVLAALLLAAPAAAQSPAPPPDFSSLQPLAGSWTCARTDATGNLGGIGTIQHVTYAPVLGGQWLLQTTVDEAAKHPSTALAYIGFDTLAKKWVVIMVDDRGAYDLAKSTGLVAGAMTWNENPATSDNLPIWHRTFKLLGPTHYLSTFSGPTDLSGTLNKIKFSCTKST